MLDASRMAGFGESGLDGARSRFEEINADLVLQTLSLLKHVVADDALHPRLINTLSMLSYNFV